MDAKIFLILNSIFKRIVENNTITSNDYSIKNKMSGLIWYISITIVNF